MALFTPEQVEALERFGRRYAILFRLATPQPVRLWSGVGPLPVPQDFVETETGAIYQGLGALGDVPELDNLINGRASRLDLEMNVADPDGDLYQLGESEAVSARYRAVWFGVWPFDDDWSTVGAPVWIWDGRSDSVKVARDRTDPDAPAVQLTLSVGSMSTGRRAPMVSNYSSASQAEYDPSDRIFDNMAALNEGVEKEWPKG